jgi:demethylmenaquinone methyltransferase/2-methoxy-6-polyprenyl-1,4-benzoquinol methylase
MSLRAGVSGPTTHFGRQTIPEAEKAPRVRGVFTSVASKYDLMNDAMSLGIHRLWKDALIDWLAPRPGMRLIDVAGGTGDIAFRFLDRLKGRGEVTVLDMTAAMLEEGRARAGGRQGLTWVCGDAMALPFPDQSFDAWTISFGIRNVTRIADALGEAFRVLRPGGRLLILEFSALPVPLMQKAYDLYSFALIPRMGQALTGDRASYQYLVESIRRFPAQEPFADMIRAAGFEQVSYRNLSFGIAALHSGWKL